MARIAVRAGDIWSKTDGGEERPILVNWFVREGAQVRAGQILAEVGVEKTALEVPAPVAGILMKVEVDENGIFNWGDVLAWIETEGTS